VVASPVVCYRERSEEEFVLDGLRGTEGSKEYVVASRFQEGKDGARCQERGIVVWRWALNKNAYDYPFLDEQLDGASNHFQVFLPQSECLRSRH